MLCLVWRSLNLPDPTPIQYEIADIIQNLLKHAGVVPLPPDPTFAARYPTLINEDGKPTRRVVLEAYRGFGKSWIASTAADWVLEWNKSANIMAVSAAKVKSDEFTTFCLQLIRDIPPLQHLMPSKSLGDRCSALAFDVRGHPASQAPSVRSVGIFGQLTGGRADLIFPDDIEVPKTSETQALREKLITRSAELGGAVLKASGVVIVLGTPQCEESIYEVMCRERGYTKIVFPARYPSDKWMLIHGASLAPIIHAEMKKRGPACQIGGGLDGQLGDPTDPKRFGEFELQEREAEYARSGFQLQFMLDTTLSDRERYPLKINDIIVMDIGETEAPATVAWSSSSDKILMDLPNVGFRGDRFHAPLRTSEEWMKFQGTVMFVDPAGRGKDELAYSIVKSCNGLLYLTECRGVRGGYDMKNLVHLAMRAKAHGVNEIVTEPNFGDGMFDQLLRPVLRDHYPCTLTEGERAIAQKERRIIDVLEPVLNQHLLVVSPSVIRDDLITHEGEGPEDSQKRSLFHQLTRITKEKGCLKFDDRLDSLAGAVGYWMKQLGVDAAKTAECRRESEVVALAAQFASSAINGGRYGDVQEEVRAPSWINIGDS